MHLLFLITYATDSIHCSLAARVPFVDLTSTVNYMSVTWELDPMTFVEVSLGLFFSHDVSHR